MNVVVPNYWYLILFVIMFVFGVIAIEVWHTQLSVWGLLVAVLICMCKPSIWYHTFSHCYIALTFIIPIGMIQAITNQQIGLKYVYLCLSSHNIFLTYTLLSVISELIGGYAFPNRPIANMFFKVRIYSLATHVSRIFTRISDLWLYQHVSSHVLHFGYEARPLYENSSSPNVHVPSFGNLIRLDYATWCTSLVRVAV